MNSSQREPSTVIFVGNISFESQKNDLLKLLEEIGPVVKLRMVRDEASGKLKGYAFADYGDQRLASHAVSRFNGTEFNGRQLRVDYADQKSTDPSHDYSQSSSMSQQAQYHNGPSQGHPSQSQQHHVQNQPMHPPTSYGGAHYPDKVILDPIMGALAKVPPKELTDSLLELGEIAKVNPDQLATFLQQDPRLALFITHGLYLLGARKEPFSSLPPQNAPMVPPPTMGGAMGGMVQPPMGMNIMPLPPFNPINPINPMPMAPQPINPQGIQPMMAPPMGRMAPAPMNMQPNVPPPSHPMKSWRDDPKFKLIAKIEDEQLKKLLDITPQQLSQLEESQKKTVQYIQQYGAELRRYLR